MANNVRSVLKLASAAMMMYETKCPNNFHCNFAQLTKILVSVIIFVMYDHVMLSIVVECNKA